MSSQAEVKSNKMPKGIPYIIGNECAERFSYYGMRAILVIYMTKYLLDMNGNAAHMDEATARGWYHLFCSSVYFLPIFGAILSDVYWGKFKTIFLVSIVYCLGHLVLSMFEHNVGLVIGLSLIAIGSGGIKPVVSANVGDQFTKVNQHLIKKVFSYFYFAINFGSFFSTLMTPYLLNKYGPSVAFGLPGILMFVATIIFWLGRKKYKVVKPAGWKKYGEAIFSPAGKKAIFRLSIFYVFIALFWTLFDQSSSAWILQADRMDRMVDLRFWFIQFDWLNFEILASQTHAMNPVMVMMLIPIFTFFIYPFFGKFCKVTPLRKITVGMFVAALSFVVIAIAEAKLQNGESVNIVWQVWAYLIITASEIMVSITALEFSYTQAPNNMKSIIMGIFLLSVTLGNLIAAGVNFFIRNADGTVKLVGADYYWFFTILMVIAGILFAIVARFYKEERYIQGEEA
jgi:proton-dependent oligopeptide transporter, POT family